MIQIQSTVQPSEMLSQVEWMKEFRVGLMAKPKKNDRPKQMMELWKDKNGNVDFTHTIQKLKP